MIQTCSKCKNYDISISDEPCRECQKAFRRGEGKPNFIASITNADRIRAMTDEELANFLALQQIGVVTAIYKAFDEPVPDALTGATEEWLAWLKQEATP